MLKDVAGQRLIERDFHAQEKRKQSELRERFTKKLGW